MGGVHGTHEWEEKWEIQQEGITWRPMHRWEDYMNERNRMTGCGLNSSGSG